MSIVVADIAFYAETGSPKAPRETSRALRNSFAMSTDMSYDCSYPKRIDTMRSVCGKTPNGKNVPGKNILGKMSSLPSK